MNRDAAARCVPPSPGRPRHAPTSAALRQRPLRRLHEQGKKPGFDPDLSHVLCDTPSNAPTRGPTPAPCHLAALTLDSTSTRSFISPCPSGGTRPQTYFH
eukprot:171161-Chlamydomonas_euryale.AAC.1